MSDSTTQARIAAIIGEASRCPPIRTRRISRNVLIASCAVVVAMSLAAATMWDFAQQRLPITDLQLRQLQGYVCLLSEAGEAPPERLWHELKLFFDVESVHTLRRADFERAIEWLDRRARRAIGRPEPRLSGARFCGLISG